MNKMTSDFVDILLKFEVIWKVQGEIQRQENHSLTDAYELKADIHEDKIYFIYNLDQELFERISKSDLINIWGLFIKDLRNLASHGPTEKSFQGLFKSFILFSFVHKIGAKGKDFFVNQDFFDVYPDFKIILDEVLKNEDENIYWDIILEENFNNNNSTIIEILDSMYESNSPENFYEKLYELINLLGEIVEIEDFSDNIFKLLTEMCRINVMKTLHKFIKSDSRNIKKIEDNSVDLVVTSPPYPMVKMWDEIMINKEPEEIAKDIDYKKMSDILDGVWKEMYRVVKPGGLMALNMGDLTRSNKNGFKLYSNASKIIQSCTNYGFEQLPGIIWSKPTNSPNKFLGSGMYPVMAYITLEHEHILIFRKGKNRKFTKEQMEVRRESDFSEKKEMSDFLIFERWQEQGKILKGCLRERNAAYPIEIPYRLINMFSIKGDTVLDPFVGTGTTSIAAAASERNSIGVDLMGDFIDVSIDRLKNSKRALNTLIEKRIEKHEIFSKTLKPRNKYPQNRNHNFYVKTSWETDIKFNYIENISKKSNEVVVEYKNREL